MEFYEVLDQVIELLRSRGWVTYGALQAQFQLDNDLLETLKDELLFSYPVVDQEGRGLVWADEGGAKPASSSQRVQAVPRPPGQQEHPPQVQPPPSEPTTPDAERRQLTVMFCDLVGSTHLSAQLDPEDYREVLRAYHATCAEVIHRFDGYIAQYLGDALLVYFGYPQAHEDDAQRAVRTGLGMLDALGTLNTRLEREKGLRLAIRVGIHTGLVVVGAMDSGGYQERLALGNTPNVASRIQGLAEPDSVVMSASTSRLVQGYFECQELGEQRLRSIAEPLAIYRVLQASSAQSRLDIARAHGLTPLVGREQEVGRLIDRWKQVKNGHGQIVLLRGEAGIGKSRLVQALKDHIADAPHTRLECRSSPYYQNTALYPFIDLFQRLLQWQAGDTPDEKLRKLEQTLSAFGLSWTETVPLFAPLLSLSIPEDRYPPLHLSPQKQRQKTLATIVAIILECSEPKPVLFILEDLHWTDPTTLACIDLLLDQTPTAATCVLLTCRPAFQPSWSPRSSLTEMTVNRLSQPQIARMAEQVAGAKRLPAAVMAQITEKTDGVPLYIEEMIKAVLESGMLEEAKGHYDVSGPLTSVSIPVTLQDSLMARLDRLVTAKAVAQYASVLGRQFPYAWLHAVSQLDEATLQHELSRLIEAEIVYQRGLPPQATYVFKHALIRDTAYESLLRSTRQGHHRRIAEVLAERFPETAQTQPELLAHHFSEAGCKEQAVNYWYHAGQRAVERSAHLEAIAHLTNGLEELTALSETPPRTQQELTFLLLLGPALIATKGYTAPEVAHAYNRAYALCRHVGEPAQRCSALAGLLRFYLARGELGTARQIGEQLLTLAQHQYDPTLLLEAYWVSSSVLCLRGELTLAQAHLDQAIALYDAQRQRSQTFRHGTIPGIHCLSWASWTLWMRGFADQARQRSHEALSLVRQLPPSFTLGFVLNRVALLHQFRREWSLTQEYAEALIELSTEQGFEYWLSQGTILRGWALAMKGQEDQGIAQMCQGLDTYRVLGAGLHQPQFLPLLAEAYGKRGQAADGLAVLAEALAGVEKTGACLYEAELFRLQGDLILQQSSENHAEAETCFHQALVVARRQQAKSWELRAATSLARLWQAQGKRQAAHDLLAPVYGWFTEGLDTADLKDAKASLEALG
jgi:class 3 adenylate cyclase/predicted ATPase